MTYETMSCIDMAAVVSLFCSVAPVPKVCYKESGLALTLLEIAFRSDIILVLYIQTKNTLKNSKGRNSSISSSSFRLLDGQNAGKGRTDRGKLVELWQKSVHLAIRKSSSGQKRMNQLLSICYLSPIHEHSLQ